MTRRMFYVALGATVGILVVRKASQAAKRFTPAGVQSSVSGAFGGLGQRFGDFTATVREGMAEREEQLRTELGLDGSHDVVDS
ncbi:MAG: hypothetical protein JWN77_2924 [Frankiales bacterium]|jgi:hypothetical protein|nr:hypothetical protein [Frankiales bacterium]